jgi:hypothetical protein
MADFRTSLGRNLSNIVGWRTNRKIIVIESDDWGSQRMPSIDAFARLEKHGLDLRSCDAERYNTNDSLEGPDDLEALFEVLSGHCDKNNNNPIVTAVSVVANPDFEKIRQTDFQEYFYENILDSFARYNGDIKSFDLWLEGKSKKLFEPQLHGREHLNVNAWMSALKSGHRETMLAFKEGIWGFVPDKDNLNMTDYQAAFLFRSLSELEDQKKIVKEGVDLFSGLLGYKPDYFVPPNGPFHNSLNKELISNGIRFRSSAKIQHEPIGDGESRRVLHWLGQKEKTGITYITRNCFFEPGIRNKDWVGSCLNDMKIAFSWKKPVIISSHRVNYIGKLRPDNRKNGLTQLDFLLKSILKSWPDCEFMTTSQLGYIINQE